MVLAVAVALALGGCQSDDEPDATPTSVDAFPESPHVAGPLRVELQPALRQMRATDSYRPLGTPRSAVVDEVGTARSADHTSWGTTVRFSADSRDAVRRARDEAAGLGGVVLVTVGGTVVMVAAPSETTPRRIERLGLEKAEAWSLVNAFD